MVRSLTVSSKLSSGKWPRPERVANKVIRTLQEWGALRHQQRQPQQRTCSPSGNRAEASESRDQTKCSSGPDTGGGVRAAAHSELETRTRRSSGDEDTRTARASAVTSSGGALPAGQEEKIRTDVGSSGAARCSTGGGLGRDDSGDGAPENWEANNLADGTADSVDTSVPQKQDRSVDTASSAGVAVTSAIAPSVGVFSLSVEDVLAEVGRGLSRKRPYLGALDAHITGHVNVWVTEVYHCTGGKRHRSQGYPV